MSISVGPFAFMGLAAVLFAIGLVGDVQRLLALEPNRRNQPE